ncbi:MAG: adenylate/guanylate cyclase domain-containing protein [Microscillaceae bacterium]|nr:adenylate/guanylate cyclase domain-containing protein [Microscillaceae bacterium]
MSENQEKEQILYVDDEPDNLTVFKSNFRRFYKVHTASSAGEGMEILRNHDVHVIITDQRMPEITGVEFLESIIDDFPDSIRMILTGFSDVEAIIKAINQGQVYRYITKPWDREELKITIDKALESFHLRKENKNLIASLKEANQNLERKVQERTAEVNAQKKEIESLLHNILPEEIAADLRQTGQATPKHYELVTVLFSDFKGFTQLAEKLSPEELIQELNYCFLGFDEIIEKYNLEKIKTIGDAYMCAGGIPVANTSNPVDTVRAAIEMQAFIKRWKQDKEAKGEQSWHLRIGIHTGPLIAGVIGKKKFAYDIWGDTVNLAARMESSGEIDTINISGSTYELVKDHFHCTYRGKIQAKNKGEVDMYFVDYPIG